MAETTPMHNKAAGDFGDPAPPRTKGMNSGKIGYRADHQSRPQNATKKPRGKAAPPGLLPQRRDFVSEQTIHLDTKKNMLCAKQ